MRLSLRHLAATAGALPLLAVIGAAHESWVAPSSYLPCSGELVVLEVRVGEAFRGDAVARREERIRRFAALDPAGEEVGVPGRDGHAPAGYLRPDAPGAWVVGYETVPSRIDLPAEEFHAYLEQEGLVAARAQRERLGEASEAGREAYARSSKSLLSVDGGGAGFDRVIGLPLELVPLESPFTAREKTSFRLLLRGEPVGGVLVQARRRDSEDVRRARTGDDGVVSLAVDAAGDWLVHCVHMERAADEDDFEWSSTWASLTFAAGPGR